MLYPLAKQFPAAFNDVKNGTNTVPCAIGSTDCIAVSNPLTITDPNYGTAVEGEIGTGTTAEYNAAAGYDLASGLGTVDANQLVSNWGSVTFTSSTTTLTPSKTTFAHGTSITVSGTVTTSSGTPTGDVALMTNSTEPGQQGQSLAALDNSGSSVFTLASGSYSGSVATLPGGTYNIWGQYSGDANNAESNSTPVQITVTPENSTLNFNIYSGSATYTSASTPGTSVDYGTQFLLSAQPSPSAGGTNFTEPSGTVTFSDKSTGINTAVVNAEGDAEYNAPFAVGTHSVTASYSGDQSYNSSTASAIAFTVVKDTPQIGLSAANQDGGGDYISGQSTVFNVQVANNAQLNLGLSNSVAPPTGKVTVTGFPSGVASSATLSPATSGFVEGVATLTAPANTPAGNYNVTINYAGDANYNSSSINGSISVVSQGGVASTTTATMSGSISPTTNITITGTVTGKSGSGVPTGGILVYTSGNVISELGLTQASTDSASFSVVFNSQNLPQGANFITLQYTGDSTYQTSAYTLNSGGPITNPLSDFTMVPDTTIAAVALPGDAVTVPINMTSVNGFSGAVAVTAATNAAIGVQIPASVTLTANGSQTFNLVLTSAAALGSGTFNVLLTGTDSTGKYIHTLGLQLVVGGNVAPTGSFSLSNSGNISVAPGATTGNTSTITVAPVNSFTGTVALTCAVVGPSGATSPATCTLASPSVAGGSGTDVLTVATTSTTTPGTYTVTVTGISGSITQTTVVTATVAPASFALSASATTLSLAPGATSGNTSTISVTPSGGFTGAVALTCSISPTAASDPATCSFSPASVTISGATAQTSTLTINTTAATTAQNKPMNLFWPSAGGAALAMVFFFGIPARKRNWVAMLGLLVLFVSLAGLGCGGGGSGGGGGGGGNTGTTPGTYTVTINGASGSTNAMPITVTLTVN